MSLPLSFALAFLSSAQGSELPLPVAASIQSAGSSQSGAALAVDQAFLHLLDGGEYDEAWKQSSPSLQRAVSKENFSEETAAAREPFGAFERRKLLSVTASTSLSGAPDGHYIVAEFSAVFSNKKDATETIVAAESEGGDWQVAGYHVR